jgi:hypothetical protein
VPSADTFITVTVVGFGEPDEEQRKRQGWKGVPPTTQTDPPYDSDSKLRILGNASGMGAEEEALLTPAERARLRALAPASH